MVQFPRFSRSFWGPWSTGASLEELGVSLEPLDLPDQLDFELIPMYPDDVKAVLVSKRIAIDESEINTILDIVRQHVGFE